MKIGGLIKSSMIDYPGKISCVVFTCGCNFICPFCHNASLIPMVADEDMTDFHPELVISFLEKRKGLLEGVVITGGEPTLQKDLVSFCQIVKELGYPIKLDTNGSCPDVLRVLLEDGLVDYLAMDIKALPSEYYPLITKDNNYESLQESIGIIMASEIMYEFRTTCARPFVNTQMIQKISEMIRGAKRFALQTFNPDNILNPGFYNRQEVVYEEAEIKAFAEIAREYVQSCIIR